MIKQSRFGRSEWYASQKIVTIPTGKDESIILMVLKIRGFSWFLLHSITWLIVNCFLTVNRFVIGLRCSTHVITVELQSDCYSVLSKESFIFEKIIFPSNKLFCLSNRRAINYYIWGSSVDSQINSFEKKRNWSRMTVSFSHPKITCRPQPIRHNLPGQRSGSLAIECWTLSSLNVNV